LFIFEFAVLEFVRCCGSRRIPCSRA